MLWLKNGSLVINGSGNLIDCAICPCPGGGGILTDCNGAALVPASLTATIFFNSTSFDVELNWSGDVNWEVGGPDVNMCGDIDFRSISLVCGLVDHDVWYLEFVWTEGGIQQSVITGSGIDPITIVDDDPIHYTTTIPGGIGSCVTTDVLIDIHPTP